MFRLQCVFLILILGSFANTASYPKRLASVGALPFASTLFLSPGAVWSGRHLPTQPGLVQDGKSRSCSQIQTAMASARAAQMLSEEIGLTLVPGEGWGARSAAQEPGSLEFWPS